MCCGGYSWVCGGWWGLVSVYGGNKGGMGG